jgi:hypothetical protein
MQRSLPVRRQEVEATWRRHHANWVDGPVPALEHNSPRQAMQTPAGLERVKGLIRSDEVGEEDGGEKGAP